MMSARACLIVLAATACPVAASAADRGVRGETARPCPRHGPGFVEVPGTTTCIRVSGRVRAEATASTRRYSRDDVPGFSSRGQVAVDTRTDTAYGPLRSYVRMRAGHDTRP